MRDMLYVDFDRFTVALSRDREWRPLGCFSGILRFVEGNSQNIPSGFFQKIYGGAIGPLAVIEALIGRQLSREDLGKEVELIKGVEPFKICPLQEQFMSGRLGEVLSTRAKRRDLQRRILERHEPDMKKIRRECLRLSKLPVAKRTLSPLIEIKTPEGACAVVMAKFKEGFQNSEWIKKNLPSASWDHRFRVYLDKFARPILAVYVQHFNFEWNGFNPRNARLIEVPLDECVLIWDDVKPVKTDT